MYWMNKKHLVGIIESKTQGVQLTKEQMESVATTIREPMWQWHEIFAHVMVFALIARIIYMLAKGIRFSNPFKGNLNLKDRLQGLTYVYFYAFVFISAFTGIIIEKGFFPEWKESVETIHKLGLYWFPIFILLHLGGIILTEMTNKKGIVSKMIGGD